MSATENKLIKNLKDSGILLSISPGIGVLSKKNVDRSVEIC